MQLGGQHALPVLLPYELKIMLKMIHVQLFHSYSKTLVLKN